MENQNCILMVDYRDDRVRIAGKSYPAGTFATHLLNQFYENDTAGRLSVFKQYGWNVVDQLNLGYLNERQYIAAGQELLYILDTLPKLKPFNTLDIQGERHRISTLFTEEVAEGIKDHFCIRANIANRDDGQVVCDIFPAGFDRKQFQTIRGVIDEVQSTISFYHSISKGMQKAFAQLKEFVRRLDEVERFDEAHLLPLALKIIGEPHLEMNMQYVPHKKTAKSNYATVARRFYFTNYYSFVLTDFFEGLHNGHYPRRCEVCGRYFLMQSARRQKYCTGKSPYAYRGRILSCKEYAALCNRKEKADADPIVDIYTRRCNAIRSEKSRGSITAELAEEALRLAKEYKLMAQDDMEYANSQYSKDMEHDTLYRAANCSLNRE